MAKKLFLSIQTRSTSTKNPIYEIWINGHVSSAVPVITVIDDKTQSHVYQDRLTEINTIDIKLLNKEPHDTKINEQGQISEDLLLIIDSLKIDHVDLTDKLSAISFYKDIYGKVHRTAAYITFAGTYRIKLHHNLLYTEWLASYL